MSASYTEKFSSYFDREVAKKAAKSLGDGAEVEFQVETETFTFTKQSGNNAVKAGAARDPQLLFTLSSGAADAILADTSDDVGAIVRALDLNLNDSNQNICQQSLVCVGKSVVVVAYARTYIY